MSFKKQPDFIAMLHFLNTEQGGRACSAYSGYRPHIKFSHSEYLTSGEQIYIDTNSVMPGESVKAEIRILAVDVFKNDLEKGILFKFCEGNRIIGFGEIMKVTNPDLQKSRNHVSAELANLFMIDLNFRFKQGNQYEATHDGKLITLIMNDFPHKSMWTMLVGSKSIDFDDRPKNWTVALEGSTKDS